MAKNQKEFIHSLILVFATCLTFIFPETKLKDYDLQFSAILFIFLFIAKRFIPKQPKTRLLESVIFTLIILGIINTTGGLQSPFFFLIYFLLFSLSLLLEPVIPISISITLISLYLFTLPPHQTIKNLLPIFSLAFITPFAMILGKEYLENEKLKKARLQQKEDTFLFLSLVLKNHIKNIIAACENFTGNRELEKIKKSARRAENLINKFEKSI